MKRKQIDLDKSTASAFQNRTRTEATTIPELVRKAAQPQAMQAVVGIRANNRDREDSTAIIRRMRSGTRLSRLTT